MKIKEDFFISPDLEFMSYFKTKIISILKTNTPIFIFYNSQFDNHVIHRSVSNSIRDILDNHCYLKKILLITYYCVTANEIDYNCAIDISLHLSLKKELLNNFKSQFEKTDNITNLNKYGLEYLISRDKYYGIFYGKYAVELFKINKTICIDNINELYQYI